jgi:hypothetical protein
VPEIYYEILTGALDELPRQQQPGCRQCARWQGRGDGAEIPYLE